MPVPTVITDLSATAASNYPAGSDAPSELDNVQRAHGGFIRNLLDATQTQAYTAYTTGGTTTAYTITTVPAAVALAAGQRYRVKFNAANTSTTPTLARDGLTAKALKVYDTAGAKADPAVGALALNMLTDVEYDGTDFVVLDQLPAAPKQLVNAQTDTTYTYLTGDRSKLVTHSNAAAIAGTLPQAGTSFPDGWYMDVSNKGAGTLTITPTTSTIGGAATLVLATGQAARIVSDGTNYQFFRAGASIVSGVVTATTSGTSIDFSGIPSWARRITIMFNSVSTNGTSLVQVRLGTGGIVTTGYVSNHGNITSGGGVGGDYARTTGFAINGAAAADARSGHMFLTHMGSNAWVVSSSTGVATSAGFGSGNITLAGVLDTVRITTVNGTDAFDAGSANILIE